MSCKKKPILLIEDSEDIRDVFSTWMDMEGYKIESCGTAEEALQLLRGGLEPCMMLVDLSLPKIKGDEFIEKVLEEELTKGAPIYVFSAHSVQTPIDGTHGWVRKPVDLNQVIGILKALEEGSGQA
jgi:CheY-like chemotaxis protein